MSGLRRKLLLQALKSFDLFITISALMTATFVVSSGLENVNFSEFLSLRIQVQNYLVFLGLIFVSNLVFSSAGFYHSKRLSKRSGEAIDMLKAVSLNALLLAGTAFVFQIGMVTWVFIGVFGLTSFILLVVSRLILRNFLAWVRVQGRNLRDVLIIGTNKRAVEFVRGIESKPELGYQVIGFVDEGWDGLDIFKQTGYPLVCGLDDLDQFLRNKVVDEVMIGLPLKSYYQKSAEIADLCGKLGIIVRFLSDIFDLKVGQAREEQFEGDNLVTVYRSRMEDWPALVKRMFDWSLALCLLVLLSPLFLITALLVKLTSPGSTLFVQERVGFNKRRFQLYKFRTMVTDAEQRLPELEHLNELSGPVFKIRKDPRVTKIGRFLRKTSIDELPQLINVLKGDMSLVGPRPLPVRDVNGFGRDWHRRRFSVRPGITCLWQIDGRNEVPFEKWMDLDMQYIDHWSLWLDLKILVKTIPAVLKGSGAV